jgi:hypothetical protein
MAVAMAAAPADAQTKKKSSSKPAQVTVNKGPTMVGHFHACASSGAQLFANVPLLALITVPFTTVGCGLVYAVPVMVESFVVRGA